MKNSFLLLSIVLSVLFLVSCTQPTSPIIGNSNGVFHGKITLVDSTGSHPVNGTLSLHQDNSNNFTGNWSLENGQSGKLAGSINNSKVNLNLNPDVIDANTFLIGDFDGKSIKGQWFLSGIIGVLNKGTFVATSY